TEIVGNWCSSPFALFECFSASGVGVVRREPEPGSLRIFYVIKRMVPMDVAMSFLPLWQVFAAEMSQPIFQTFLILVSGWLMVPRRTISGMGRASGTNRYHAAFYRLFAAPAGRSMGGSL